MEAGKQILGFVHICGSRQEGVTQALVRVLGSPCRLRDGVQKNSASRKGGRKTSPHVNGALPNPQRSREKFQGRIMIGPQFLLLKYGVLIPWKEPST